MLKEYRTNRSGARPLLAIQRLPQAQPLISGLSNLILHVTSNAIDLKLTVPLLKSVVTRAEDQQIWNGIFDLIAQTRPVPRPTTPPLSVPSIPKKVWICDEGRFEVDNEEDYKEYMNHKLLLDLQRERERE